MLMTQDRQSKSHADKLFPGNGGFRVSANQGNVREVANAINRGHITQHNLPSWIQRESASMFEARRRRVAAIGETMDWNDPEQKKALSRLMQAAARRDVVYDSDNKPHDAMRELAAFREWTFQAEVMPSLFAMAAFQQVDLSADELPLIHQPQPSNLNSFNVYSCSLSGMPVRNQWTTTSDMSMFTMETLTTEKVMWHERDLQVGDINKEAAIRAQLASDMTLKLDGFARTNIDNAKRVSGLRALLNIHPLVRQENIPDTNYLNLSGTDPTVLTLDKLKQILKHMYLFGLAGGTGGGSASESFGISSIICSPLQIMDTWEFVSLVSGFGGGEAVEPSGTVPDDVRNAIFSGGQISSAWGQSWTWQPNTQIPKGKLYIFSNQPLGWFVTKSELDKTITWDKTNSPDMAEQERGETVRKMPAKFYVPELFLHRVLIVDL